MVQKHYDFLHFWARPGVLAERHAPDPHQTLYLCTKVGFPMLGPGPLPLFRTVRTPTAKCCLGKNIWEASGRHLGCSRELGGQGGGQVWVWRENGPKTLCFSAFFLVRPGILAERHAPDPHQTLYLCTKVGFPMLGPRPLPLFNTARTPTAKSCLGKYTKTKPKDF